METLLFTLICFLSASCVGPTKPWHLKTTSGTPLVIVAPSSTMTVPQTPPRGPEVSPFRAGQIRIGQSGDRIFALAGGYPMYDHSGRPRGTNDESGPDLAFVTTRVFGAVYEIAFLYTQDGSGRIADISYLPIEKDAATKWKQSQE